MKKNYTYGEWLKDWFKIYKEPYIKYAKTLKGEIKRHIPQSLKNTRLTDLTALDLQKALNSVEKSRTAQDVYKIYFASLKLAFKLELIPKDLSIHLIKPRHKQKQGQALTQEEITALLDNLKGERLENFYKFCLFSGCRRSEALSIKWQDIDLVNESIHIRGTKTTTSDRYIPIFTDLKTLLDSLERKGEYLFNHRANHVTHAFKKYCPNHKLHDLRHTFATKCLECGISLKIVQGWLGHADITTTANIYSHCLVNIQKNESIKLKF